MPRAVDHETQRPEEALIEAAIWEFDSRGFARASTNRIAERAGVSKGLLFHYFGTKRRLYLEALKKCIDFYIERFLQETEHLSPDLLERVVQFSLIKLRLVHEAPKKYGVILSFAGVAGEFKDELKQEYREYETLIRDSFLAGVDMTRLRAALDRDRALEFLALTLNALEHNYLRLYRSRRWTREDWTSFLPQAHAELEEYVDLLRHGLYEP